MARTRKTAGDGEPPDKKPFLLRLPVELMTELRGWAEQELRSLNGHIEYLLRDAVRRRKSGRPARAEGEGEGEPDRPAATGDDGG